MTRIGSDPHLLPRMPTRKEPESETDLDLNPGLLIWDPGVLTDILTLCEMLAPPLIL